jgi:PsbP-like protein
MFSRRVNNTFRAGTPRTTSARLSPRARAWAVAVCLFAVLAGAGALIWRGGAFSGEPNTAVSESNGLKTYTDPDYGYSFEYPADWVLQEDAPVETTSDVMTAAAVFAPDGARAGGYSLDYADVVVYELGYAPSESDLRDMKGYLQDMYDKLADQDATLKVTQAVSETTVGGLSGYKTVFTYDVEGTPITCIQYYVFDETLEYDLSVQAATENWTLDQVIFDAVIASFKPGPEPPPSLDSAARSYGQ